MTARTVKVDAFEFDIDSLSHEAKQQLDMLLACENKLRELQRDTAFAQTARNAYTTALKALLPTTDEHFRTSKSRYEELIAKEPDHADATHSLGLIERECGNPERALSLLRKAVQLDPSNPAYQCNLGNILRDARDYTGAEAAYRTAIRLQPEFADALNNFAVLYLRTRQHEKALDLLKQAVQMNPTHVNAQNNMGYAMLGLGCVNEAIEAFNRVLRINPRHADAHYNLGNGALGQDNLPAALDYFRNAQALSPKSVTGLASAFRQAIIHYLRFDHVGAQLAIDTAKHLTMSNDWTTKPSMVYLAYLERLLQWWREQGLNSLTDAHAHIHVIGESHALSVHGVNVKSGQACQCISHWIEGCKQWHLGNHKPNQFKLQFENIMAHLPTAAQVLVTIGEIDCRHDEGLIQKWKSDQNVPISQLIRTTVAAYLEYLDGIAKKYKHRLIVCGVPASNFPRGAIPLADQPILANVIQTFNQELKAATLRHGFGFVDLYSMTVGQDGFSNGVWHMDEHHLRPDAWRVALETWTSGGL